MSMRKPLAAALLIASFGCGSASADGLITFTATTTPSSASHAW